ncbi:MAG: single-stranded-DNA-specific exonuclease RecJ [Deltaproteobacteria bacterium]|nr:single-stranded-DNA-specific exonuclease RecJ [Deltaproteobacteria bacterium]
MSSETSEDWIARDGYRLRSVSAESSELAQRLRVSPAFGRILWARGLRTPESARDYLDARLTGLSDPTSMADRELAADRLARATQTGERVVVFGDYDVDGTTSAAILADVLEELGAEVQTEVASRFTGGYGLSEQALDRCLESRPGLLVTCDCGSSDHERLERARAAGVDVVVVDHHLVPERPLPVLAFLNPHRADCGYGYLGLASAGLALSLAAALRKRLGVDLDVRRWLDLVALGTIADVAPLDGDNRRLVRAGLQRLGDADARPGVTALRDAARVRWGKPLSARDVGFRLGPRLNAAGRLGDPSLTLALLRSRSEAEARGLAAEIESMNDERRRLSDAVTCAAEAQVREIYGDAPSTGVVAAAEGWHPGVVGITAARLVDAFHVPAVVIALDGEQGSGSARAPEGFDIHAALAQCSAELSRFGGHRAAAGMSIERSRVEAFRAAYTDVSAFQMPHADAPLMDAEVDGRASLPMASELASLEPLGQGNPAPRFALTSAEITERRVVGDGHLKLSLDVGGVRIGAFGPRMGELAKRLPKRPVPYGQLAPDSYRGGAALELSIEGFVHTD